MPRLLTDRQGDVLRLLCAGMTYREAAAVLGITPAGVDTLVVYARRRLGYGPVAELCARCPDDLAAAEERAKRHAVVPQDETNATA